MTPHEVRELVSRLKHSNPCVMEFKRRVSKLRCMRGEMSPALARDVMQLLRVRGEILKMSNGDYCGLNETMEMLSRQPPESIVDTAWFEDIDDVFPVFVGRDARREFQCIRMRRQTSSHTGLRALLGKRVTDASGEERTTVLRFGLSELRIMTASLEISRPATRSSELVGQALTNVRDYAFGVSLSFDRDLTVGFDKGELRSSDRVWRVPDPAMYGERVEGF